MFRVFLAGVASNLGMLGLFNWMRKLDGTQWRYKDSIFASNRGEAGAGDKTTTTSAPAGEEAKFTQAQLESIIGQRLARMKEQYQDYEDLKTFKSQHEKDLEMKTQKELEAQKKYEEAQKMNVDKISQLEKLINDKNAQVQDMQVTHALTAAINANNGYIEESLALLKGSAIVSDDGTIKIKGKDANNIDTQLDIEAGVKQFLEKRPHLVKVNPKGGAGTASASEAGAGSVQSNDLQQLNIDYQQALNMRDMEGAKKAKAKIQSILATKGGNVIGA